MRQLKAVRPVQNRPEVGASNKALQGRRADTGAAKTRECIIDMGAPLMTSVKSPKLTKPMIPSILHGVYSLHIVYVDPKP